MKASGTDNKSQISAVSRAVDRLRSVTRCPQKPPPPSSSHLHPSRLHRTAALTAPPNLSPQDGDVFLTYISSMPLTLTLSFASSSLPLFYFRLLPSHFETQRLPCFDSLFSSSACPSFPSSTQVYIIIPALMK